jgi:DNA-binding XRE family transcriptional regulator
MKLSEIKNCDTLTERFWSKVDTTGDCWKWVGADDDRGYGQMGIILKDKFIKQRAHRISYLLEHGEIPDELDCLHTCDTPSCVKPDHLFWGTHADNMRDAFRKGRRTNETTNMNKLTREQVEIIRAREILGEHQNWLAAEYDVRSQTIWRIANNKRWGDCHAI